MFADKYVQTSTFQAVWRKLTRVVLFRSKLIEFDKQPLKTSTKEHLPVQESFKQMRDHTVFPLSRARKKHGKLNLPTLYHYVKKQVFISDEYQPIYTPQRQLLCLAGSDGGAIPIPVDNERRQVTHGLSAGITRPDTRFCRKIALI